MDGAKRGEGIEGKRGGGGVNTVDHDQGCNSIDGHNDTSASQHKEVCNQMQKDVPAKDIKYCRQRWHLEQTNPQCK